MAAVAVLALLVGVVVALESGHTIQSGLLADQSWTTDLPVDKHGEWRWTVSVVRDGRTVVTSSEWMFWFKLSGSRFRTARLWGRLNR